MNKYDFMRFGCITIIGFIMINIGYDMTTWQFWTIYILVWVVVEIQFIEDHS